MRMASVLVLFITTVACLPDTPPPPAGPSLGALPRTALPDWAADCAAPITEEPTVKGLDPRNRGLRKLAFQRATHRFVCKPPGWAVYVDDADQIVGLCVDDKHSAGPDSTDTIEEDYVRALPLLLKHGGLDLALNAAAGGCRLRPVPLPHGLVRWKQYVPIREMWGGVVVGRTGVGSRFSCCWEHVVTPQDYVGIQ